MTDISHQKFTKKCVISYIGFMKSKTTYQFDVVIYSKDTALKKQIKSVCEEAGVTMIVAKVKTDLLAYNYRIAFVDKSQLDDDLINAMNEMSEFEKLGEWKFVILGGTPDYIPAPLRLYTKTLTKPNKEALIKIINRNATAKSGVNSEALKKRIHRIIYLYHYAQENTNLSKNHLCDTLKVTDRTLFRDLKILRELFPDKNFHLEREYK